MRKPGGILCGWFTFQFSVYWLETLFPLGDARWLVLALGGACITMLIFKPELTSAFYRWTAKPDTGGGPFSKPWIAFPALLFSFFCCLPPVYLTTIYGLRLSVAFWLWITDGDGKSFIETFDEVVEKANQQYK